MKNIVKKSYLLVEFGPLNAHAWLQNGTFAAICSDYRIIMQDPARYVFKCNDLLESLERELRHVRDDTRAADDSEATEARKKVDVFISYSWSNSHEAVGKGTRGLRKDGKSTLGWLDPRTLRTFFAERGIECWLDTHEASGVSHTTSNAAAAGLFGDIAVGLNKAAVVVACFSDEYVASTNCSLELRFAHVSLRLPIVKCVVGNGNEWRKHDMAFLSANAPEINFQQENPGICMQHV